MLTRRLLLRAATATAALVLVAGCTQRPHYKLDDVSSVLSNLQFQLVDDSGAKVDASSYAGQVVLLYFGYTHCPDVCPQTMSAMAQAVDALGADAARVRILFVSVDPQRDTLPILQAYTRAFSARAVGLSGTMAQIQDVTKRYHVAFNYGDKDKSGNYPVNHSAAIYVFDAHGAGQLIGSDQTPAADLTHDLKLMLAN